MLSVENIVALLRDAPFPVTLMIVVVYSILCEIAPERVTKENTNAYSSMVQWNVTDRSLRFQIMLYYLYHQTSIAHIVHIVTIFVDTLLWTMYVHYLFDSSPKWSFSVIIILCLLQALTFSNIRLKVMLISLELVLVGGSGLLYHYYLQAWYPSDMLFGHVSLLLILNACARFASHFVEALPVNFPGLNNRLPIKGWYCNKEMFYFIIYPPRLLKIFIAGTASELQAGLPVRLLTPCLVLLLTKLGWADSGLNMKQIRDRAAKIDLDGWQADIDTATLFPQQGQPFKKLLRYTDGPVAGPVNQYDV
jgi:hypothetical protein